MRKFIGVTLALVMLLSLVGCSAKKETTTETATTEVVATATTEAAATTETTTAETTVKDSYYIGFSILTTQGDFMSMLATKLTEQFTAGGNKFEVASADGNATKQIEQIENFITMGVDEILIMAIDPSSLGDVIKKAQDKGIKVVAFSAQTPVYDAFVGIDEYEVGKQTAQMAADWIDKTFPDAADGSVQVAILENRNRPTDVERSDGDLEIEKLTKKAKIVSTTGIDGTPVSAQAAAENIFMTNKDVKAVICYNADTAVGVNSYVMSLNSVVKDKSQVGAFGVDYQDQAAELIKQSVTNESVFRGTIRMGESLESLLNLIVDTCMKTVKNELPEKDVYNTIFQVTAENVDKQ